MTQVATSNRAFKIIAIDLDGALYHLVGQELSQRVSIPEDIYAKWQPKVGGWVDFHPLVNNVVRGRYNDVVAVYRDDLLPNTVGDFDGDNLTGSLFPIKNPMNFSRLDGLMEYSNNRDNPDALSLIKSMRVFTQRYGSAYAAVLLQNASHEEEAYSTLSDDYGFEHHLKARPWFPYRTADNATEAITQLLEFLNNELTTDREQLINWSVSCCELEYDLAQGGDGDFNIDPNWKLTIEQAYKS